MTTFNNGDTGLSVRTKINAAIDKVDGATPFGNNITFGDNNKAIFGAGSDLQIYHDGSGSYIDEQGSGPLYIRGSSQLFIQSSTGENYLVATANSGLNLRYNNNVRLTTTSTGVDVTGTVTADGLTVDTDNGSIVFTGTTGNNFLTVKQGLRIDLDSDNDQGATSFNVTRDGGLGTVLKASENGDISFYEDTGTTAKFFWDASAESLGIGTTSTTFGNKLNVEAQSGQTPTVRLFNYGNTAPITSYSARVGLEFISYQSASGSPYTKTSAIIANSDGTVPSEMQFWTKTNGQSSPAERLRIDSSGNVGIGITTPGRELTVNGDIGVKNSGRLYLWNDHDLNYITYSKWTGSSSAGMVFENQAGTGHLQFNTVSTERMRIDSSGNLLVGTTTTGYTNSNSVNIETTGGGYGRVLVNHLNGTASGSLYAGFSLNGLGIGSITQNGTSAVSYNTSSDYRLKEDVQPMVGASDRVLALNPVNFAWKADGARTDGFLAHEAQSVAPYAVTGEKDGEEMQSIDHSKLVPLLTAALQEALQKIEALEARVTALEA